MPMDTNFIYDISETPFSPPPPNALLGLRNVETNV
jgi:hypothetical protein